MLGRESIETTSIYTKLDLTQLKDVAGVWSETNYMMTNLISIQVEEYISYKKGLGYQIKIEFQELRRFASYTVSIEYEGSLTTDIAFQWVTLKTDYSRWYMARRMETIRTFANYIAYLIHKYKYHQKVCLEIAMDEQFHIFFQKKKLVFL